MLIPVNEIPGHARVWIYQADRKLSQEEQSALEALLSKFVEGWTAHGAPVHGGLGIYHDHFIVLFADEQATGVSGCSIDGSVRLIQDVGRQFGIDFFNRLNLAVSDREEVRIVQRLYLSDEVESGRINGDTMVFDNLVSDKSTWERSWMKPLQNTWAASAL